MAEGQCPDYPDTPCRVNLDLMPKEATTFWMWGLTAVALLVFAYGVYQMVHVWRMGKRWEPGDWKSGLKRLVTSLASHHKFKRRDAQGGANHAWIFFGFVVLFIGTTLAFIDMDIFELILEEKLLFGTGYLVYEFVLDAFGLLFILGIVFMMWRRYVTRPGHIGRTRALEAPWLKRMDGDAYALWFLLLIGVTGMLLEALRLRHQVMEDGITYAHWSFVGNAAATLFFSKLSAAQIQAAYPALWWFHFILWTSVLAILPWTKFKHIITSSLNIYYHDPERQSRPALHKPFDLQEIMESGDMDLPDVGYATIRDFTWKDRLSLDACTNCGRCEAECPATKAGRPLSPRKLIQDLRSQMWTDYLESRKDPDHAPKKLTDVEDLDLQTQIQEATLWSCVTCRGCVTACPVDIEHVDMIVEMRRALVMESKLDEHQQKLLVNMTNAGNPYGFPASDRADWTNSLPDGVEVPTASEVQAQGEEFEYLWWVGCLGSFDPRNQEVTRAVATILNAADVKFAILGTEEKCNGDPARRLGEEGRFQQSVMENLMVMQQYGVKKVITQCPHCFNTLRNEYPEFGAEFEEVIHHTELIERLIEQERLPLSEGAEMKLTYHDSCYLGRHNGIFDAPRRVLQKANNGLPVIEMADSGQQGLCCGAGGSNMWYEIKDEEERINVIRVKQAQDAGADTVVSACPFCLTMMKDGIGLTGNEESMVAYDLAEVVVRHLDWAPARKVAGAVEEAAGQAQDEPEGPAPAAGAAGAGTAASETRDAPDAPPESGHEGEEE